MRFRFFLLALIATAGATVTRAESPPVFRGVTISCPTWGREWQTPAMSQTLDEIKTLGANSFAIHPYARIAEDGHVLFRTVDEDRHITVPLDWARERGLSVMLIPHIAYWGTKFLWRGEITFETAAEWDNFFTDYETWIVGMARLAQKHGAAVFCVGLEFSYAEKFPERWLKIIAAVRQVYYGKLTYGGNWNEFENVKFWDALDYIGVLAYFPLTKTPNPSREEIAAAWEKRAQELAAFSKRNGNKQMIFVELGYNESAKAAAEPWSFKTGGENAVEIQARCYDVALGLPARYPFIAGMFLWKWFPEAPSAEEENFRLQTPTVKAVMAKHWRK